MKIKQFSYVLSLLSGLLLLAMPVMAPLALAQDQTAAADTQADDTAPPPLSAEDMNILVARIALYPDDLVALVTAASLYPEQIAEAAGFLEESAKNPDLKPDAKWDGSVISLLNYPEIVKMMSDEPDWTQDLGDAVTYQEEDVLAAIQRLREKAQDEGIIKSDDKMKVSREDDNIVITPASDEHVYVPRYEPEMLYEPGYAPAALAYYPRAYPYYYDPTATFFAAAVTGVVWGVTVDWHRHGLWGGRWGHNFNFRINCRHCYRGRNINGPMRWRDIDWRKVDRRKISFDHKRFREDRHRHFIKSLEANKRNNLHRKAMKARKLRHAKKLNLRQQKTKQMKLQGKNKQKLHKQQMQKQHMQKQKLQKQKLRKQKLQKRKLQKSKLKNNKKKRLKAGQKSRSKKLQNKKRKKNIQNNQLKRQKLKKQRANQNKQQFKRKKQNNPALKQNRSGGKQQGRRKKKKN